MSQKTAARGRIYCMRVKPDIFPVVFFCAVLYNFTSFKICALYSRYEHQETSICSQRLTCFVVLELEMETCKRNLSHPKVEEAAKSTTEIIIRWKRINNYCDSWKLSSNHQIISENNTGNTCIEISCVTSMNILHLPRLLQWSALSRKKQENVITNSSPWGIATLADGMPDTTDSCS